MLILLFFAFLSGLTTILAPCIWPLLPVLLSSSINGSKAKSFGTSIGIIISFGFLTLTISYLVRIFHFDPNILRLIAGVVIIILGVSLIIPSLSQILEGLVSRLSGKLNTNQSQNSFLGGLTLGLVLGIIWTPCAGPILATIAALSATQAVNTQVILLTSVYVLGMGIPLFLFSLLGNFLLIKSKILSPLTGRIQQAFGVVMIITAILVFTNYDTVLEARLLNFLPFLNLTTNLETNKTVTTELNNLKGSTPLSNLDFGTNSVSLPNLGKAPDFVGITHWLNTDNPITLNDLKGKVVLVDFWTYTCINCIRTLPFTTSWYNKYKDQGFVIIGIHTPEFEFEKDTNNVENAIKQYNIHYPVAQDNDYATWNAFNNEYWPAEYLIDTNGNIRHTHFGEGEYDITEKVIVELLKEKGASVSGSLTNLQDKTPTGQESPESYLGLKRIQNVATNERPTGGLQDFTAQTPPPQNYFNFMGKWDVEDEFAKPTKGATLEFNFYASKVYLVITPETPDEDIKVYLDNKIIDQNLAGQDVKNGRVILDKSRLYNLVNLKQNENHVLKLEFNSNGLELYAFTFG